MNLTDGMRNLTENIVGARHARVQSIGNLIDNVGRLRIDARKTMQTVAAEQAAELSRFAGNLADGVAATLKEHRERRASDAETLKRRLRREDKDRRGAVDEMLTNCRGAHAAMSKDMRNRLGDFVGTVVKDVAELRKAASDTIDELRADRLEAAKLWGAMTRGGATAEPAVKTREAEAKQTAGTGTAQRANVPARQAEPAAQLSQPKQTAETETAQRANVPARQAEPAAQLSQPKQTAGTGATKRPNVPARQAEPVRKTPQSKITRGMR